MYSIKTWVGSDWDRTQPPGRHADALPNRPRLLVEIEMKKRSHLKTFYITKEGRESLEEKRGKSQTWLLSFSVYSHNHITGGC